MEAGLINRVVPHERLQDEAWKWGEEIGKFDKTTLKYCKMAAHASMEAATVPAAAGDCVANARRARFGQSASLRGNAGVS